MGMIVRAIAVLPVALALAACDDAGPLNSNPRSDINPNLPESVLAVVAPNQNLSTAVVMPEDGCYWYQHVGPVETVYIPLRTVDDRPICTR
ncbi:hypothetical protein [Shimia biformata]|uniref:hypothetical protein n=1 Tax=Shimia biformata TaxID=1294299 RepID=UPI00194FF5D3|nr:hypothetical protein [Shimia biformata]